jgi:hypothetical protein
VRKKVSGLDSRTMGILGEKLIRRPAPAPSYDETSFRNNLPERECAIRVPSARASQSRVRVSLMDSKTVEAEDVKIQLIGKGPGHDFVWLSCRCLGDCWSDPLAR